MWFFCPLGASPSRPGYDPNMNRPAAIAAISLACLLLAVGRWSIRQAKHQDAPGKRTRQKLLGWTLSLAGLLAMIFGVIIW